MTCPVRYGLLDTSVFIAQESGRELGLLPEYVAISVVTLGELHLGVENAVDADTKARRAHTLSRAKASDPIALTESTMITWARMVAACRRAGIQRKVKIADALIAACAVDNGLAVVTQDGDFDLIAEAFNELDVLRV
ncbi:MAG: PIN domain-containing protein [Aeromicrobium sp.]|uniref:PIN domain-containing protein n=1 Tax=Aeromicrobium sp. TaxID=1871063 RepID=UPI0039E319CB